MLIPKEVNLKNQTPSHYTKIKIATLIMMTMTTPKAYDNNLLRFIQIIKISKRIRTMIWGQLMRIGLKQKKDLGLFSFNKLS